MPAIDLLTPLPSPPVKCPVVLPSNTVRLFRDFDWNSPSVDITIDESAPAGERDRVTQSMFDSASWLAFNLPVGRVMTMLDNINPRDNGRPLADLGNCSLTVDLVGTGQTESVDLQALTMNDCISTYFWRQVDLNMGAIEVFNDFNFTGNRVTLFLSDWNPGEVHSIEDWWLQDQISSVRWRTLQDRQTASLFDNGDGSGESFNKIKGYGDLKEIANLNDVGFNDRATSWRWDSLIPVQEIIAPLNIKLDAFVPEAALQTSLSGTNNASVGQSQVITLDKKQAQTITVSTTDTSVVGTTTTMDASVDAGAASSSVSVALSYEYTHTKNAGRSASDTLDLTMSQTFNAPPNSSYTATLVAQMGRLPKTTYVTTAQRWYDQPVTGATEDPAHPGWYLRTENVTVSVEGSLALNVQVNVNATPLPALNKA